MNRIFTDQTNRVFKQRNPCRVNNHAGTDGWNITRLTSKGVSTGCWACNCRVPPGVFTHIFTDVLPFSGHKKKYHTKEEAYEAHKKRVMKWQKDNPEKFRQYLKTYGSKESVILQHREKAALEYKNRTPEQRAAINLRAKEKYQNLPPEERAELRRKATERYYARKNK